MRPSQSNRAFADRRERCAPRQRFGIHRRAPFLPSCSSRRSAACVASNSTPGYRSDKICAGAPTRGRCPTDRHRTFRPAISARSRASPPARSQRSFGHNFNFRPRRKPGHGPIGDDATSADNRHNAARALKRA